MPSQNKSICLYGDSHLASIKNAVDAGVDGIDAFDVEFFGAPGPEFRGLRLTDDGAVLPDDDALAALKMVNGKGRSQLNGADFDVFHFHGARMRSTEFIAEFLHRTHDADSFVSTAVRAAAMKRWLSSIRSVRVARAFAANSNARVFFSPAPFETPGAGAQKYLQRFPAAKQATAADRDALNSEISAALAADGVTFVPQAEDTVESGCHTRAEFGVENSAETGDWRHMNAAYGARVLSEVIAQI